MRARPRLNIPARLVFAVSASACSSSPTTPDASADVAPVDDRASVDVVVLDALVDALAPGDATADDVRDAATADRACTVNPFDPEGGAKAVRCLPRRGATMPCPQDNVCVEADCPAHCEGCVSPLFCIPDSESDAGVSCVVSTVCSEDACNPGCRAVG
ncbi:MAG: hypothetical protein R3A48_13770 [Polyangiales bacterium]